MKKKRTGIIRLISLLLALVLLSVPAAALAQEPMQITADTERVILLEDGNKIVIITETLVSTRSTNVTKYSRATYYDSKGEEKCSFTLYGIFDSATRRCIDTSHITSTAGGTWRVEDASTRHDAFKAYGSAKFVKRVLGVKVNSKPISLELSY